MSNKNVLATRQALVLGSNDELNRLALRIRRMVKGGSKLTNDEALALAQVATVTGLDPFIGEIWYIPGGGPMVGIAGARRNDNEIMAKQGGKAWPIFTVVDPDEAGATEQEIKDVAAAFKCEIFDSIATEKYQKIFISTLETLRAGDYKDPFAMAKEICGERPSWPGYGYSTVSEKSRMNKVALAKKRAEADALKKRITIPFGVTVSVADVSPYYDVDAEGVDLEFPPNSPDDLEAAEAEVVEEVKRTEKENLQQLGFDDGN